MNQFKSILCPVDLSENSFAAIDLASTLAKLHKAKLVFLYVAPQWLPNDAMFGSEFIRETIDEDKQTFLKIRPTDVEIECDHLFVTGNPGPEIVRATLSHDLVVMNTHGRSGLMRLLMGSVTTYVLRHAECPVISYRSTGKTHSASKQNIETNTKRFVSELMHHASPVHSYEKMEDVIQVLTNAKETKAPVVDETGQCVGMLTESEIGKYRELRQRFENRDESVVDEIFETDEFGQRRAGNCDFDQVHRHMTSPVVTVSNSDTFSKAQQIFESNQNIRHLIVVDEKNCPIGFLESQDLVGTTRLSSGV